MADEVGNADHDQVRPRHVFIGLAWIVGAAALGTLIFFGIYWLGIAATSGGPR